jgi:hypothetical protein
MWSLPAARLFAISTGPSPAFVPIHCSTADSCVESVCVLPFSSLQNIDSLEKQAGLPAEAIVAAHGNFDSAKCIRCARPHPVEHVRQAVFAGDGGNACYCVKKVWQPPACLLWCLQSQPPLLVLQDAPHKMHVQPSLCRHCAPAGLMVQLPHPAAASRPVCCSCASSFQPYHTWALVLSRPPRCVFCCSCCRAAADLSSRKLCFLGRASLLVSGSVRRSITARPTC